MTNSRPKPDKLLVDIAKYVSRKAVGGAMARRLARYCLMDSLGCALGALDTPDCMKLLGPVVPGTIVPHGARVPGTSFELDPVAAAFAISCLLRWQDFNDLWRVGGHPSDNIGAILATADYLSRTRVAVGGRPLAMRDVITAMIKAYEVQGILSEGHTFNRPEIGIDSVILVKLASTAVVAHMLGAGRDEIINALSNAVVDGHPLNLYRTHAGAGARKSWAAADAASRAVWLALMAVRGEMGYPSALTAGTWGFQDVIYRGQPVDLPRPLGSYVMENVTFKIFPAQRHAQTTAECALRLHPHVKSRLGEIDRIELRTHELALRMTTTTGPLLNFAARDHCLQYIVAVALLDGDITPGSYDDARAGDPRIDELRAKIAVSEEKRYTRDYRDPEKRSNCNSLQVFFRDGSRTAREESEYALGNPARRRDGLPLVEKKFRANLARGFAPKRQSQVAALLGDQRSLEQTPVNEFMDMLVW